MVLLKSLLNIKAVTQQDTSEKRVGLVIGDSISRGHDSVDQAPDHICMAQQLQSLLGFTWVNHGVNSKSTIEWATELYYTTYINDGYRNIVLMHVGVNDIPISTPLATIQSNFRIIWDRFKALRYKIIVMSLPYSNRDIANWANVTAVNNWLVTECAAQGIFYVDYSAWSQAQKDNATYYNDTIHPTAAGYIYMASQVYSSVKW